MYLSELRWIKPGNGFMVLPSKVGNRHPCAPVSIFYMQTDLKIRDTGTSTILYGNKSISSNHRKIGVTISFTIKKINHSAKTE
jgi:hypothetical protein